MGAVVAMALSTARAYILVITNDVGAARTISEFRIDAGGEIDLLAIGWGSTGDVFQDVMCSDELRGRKIAYLHYTYLWPLRTPRSFRHWQSGQNALSW